MMTGLYEDWCILGQVFIRTGIGYIRTGYIRTGYIRDIIN